MKYPIAKPDLTGNELKYTTDAIREGWISSLGSNVKEFEREFADFVGVDYAVACNSGTTALHLALIALGIGEGDEVIVPNFTMIASAWAVTYTGAKPVFVNAGVDLNIDVKAIEDHITPKTKAIMPVHIYGRMCNMDAINKIAYEYNLLVIEDACEAHGATYNGKRAGSLSDIAAFSLYGNKIITCGNGGVVVTSDKRLYDQLIHMREMAFDPDHTFLHKKMAYNYRLGNIDAGVALGQIERINEFLEKRSQILDWYDSHLKDLTLQRPEGSVLWVYDVFFKDSEERDHIRKECAKAGIDTRYLFKPMTWQPMYKEIREDFCSELAANKGLYFPVYTQMEKEDVDFICETIKKNL